MAETVEIKRTNSEECLVNNKKLVIAEERGPTVEPGEIIKIESCRNELEYNNKKSLKDEEEEEETDEPTHEDEPGQPALEAIQDRRAGDLHPDIYQHLWKNKPTENEITNDLLYRLQKDGVMDITMQNTQNMMLKHRLLNSYPCDLCGRKFTKESHLKRHMMMHVQDRATAMAPHLMVMNHRGTIQPLGPPQHHQQQQGGEGPANNNNHKISVQNLSKYFECEMCDKKFAQASTLKNHMFTHTKEKPHACLQCGKRFALGGDLRRHVLIHTGEKPYACQQCGKRSARLDNLKKHMQTHRREGVIV